MNWSVKSVSYNSINWLQLNLPPQMAKSFPDQMSKKNICKWVFFAILTYYMIEEMALSSKLHHGYTTLPLNNGHTLQLWKPCLACQAYARPLMLRHDIIVGWQMIFLQVSACTRQNREKTYGGVHNYVDNTR